MQEQLDSTTRSRVATFFWIKKPSVLIIMEHIPLREAEKEYQAKGKLIEAYYLLTIRRF